MPDNPTFLPGHHPAHTNCYVVARKFGNQTEYYTGSHNFTSPTEAWSQDIRNARVYPDEPTATHWARVVNMKGGSRPGNVVGAYVEKAHIEGKEE